MKTILYRKELNQSEYIDCGDWKFDELPRQNDIVLFQHGTDFYKIDFVIFDHDENIEHIRIYSSRIKSPIV